MPYYDPRDPYAILGVPYGASAQAIKDAYRSLARRYHPDLNLDARTTARMQDVNWAYSVLNDPLKRSYNDSTLVAQQKARASQGSARQSSGTMRQSSTRSYTSYRARPVWNPGSATQPAQPAKQGRSFPVTATIALIFFLFRVISGAFSPPAYETNFPPSLYFPAATPISPDGSVVLLPYDPISQDEMYATQFADAGAQYEIPEREYRRDGIYWQLADRYLSEYNLTDENGMTDEVTYAWIGDTDGYVYIRTRTYGTFRLNMSLWNPSFLTPMLTVFEDNAPVTEAAELQGGCANLELHPEFWAQCRSELIDRP